MAGVDATMSEYFKRFIVPVAAIFIILRIILFIYKKLFPYIYAFFVSWATEKHHKAIKPQKDKLFSDFASLRGEDSNKRLFALEIGCGSGNNFGIYPANTSLIVVEPNTAFKKGVAKNAAQHTSLEISRFIAQGAENLKEHVGDSSLDAVISTLTLCSVDDVDAVVSEAYRVLKPGGRFYFIEHTKAHNEKSWAYILQCIMRPLMIAVAHCNPMTTPWTSVDRAGFSKVWYTKSEISKVPLVARSHVFGYAVK